MHRSFGKLAGYIIGFGSLFAIWHIASVYLLNSILFPPPARVVAKAIELAQDGTLWENASVSLQRIAAGLLLRLADRHPARPRDRLVRPSCGASWSPTPSFFASSRRRR